MSDNTKATAISVDGVHKIFRLPHERNNSFKGLVLDGLRGKFNRGYDEQHALNDINLDIKEGEFFGIVGRNGSGKSTLLKMLAGIYQPTEGTIDVEGRLVPFIELGVGFNGELTGRDNVFLNGALLGFSKAEMEERYDSIVEFAELEKFMDQKLKNYSSGMQVRLAFSLAIQTDADVLLVDEVLAVGDADFQKKCFSYFKQLKRNKKTVVFVSHDMGAVREYCDRAALINKSEVVKIGSADDIADEYTKMFAANTQEITLDETRSGEDQGTITSVKVPGLLERKAKTLKIEVDHKLKRAVDQPVVGYSIMDASGTKIMGTNNKIEREKTGDHKDGESFTVTWEVPNMFSEGVYTVQTAILDGDGITVLDWWEESAGFEVHNQRTTHYVVSPHTKMEVKKGK